MPLVPAPRARRSHNYVEELAFQMEHGLHCSVQREWLFHPSRKWRWDLALPAMKLAIEIDGGLFLPGGGRHSRGAGARNDCEKFSEGAILGWRILRVLPEWVASGKAFGLVERAVKGFS